MCNGFPNDKTTQNINYEINQNLHKQMYAQIRTHLVVIIAV